MTFYVTNQNFVILCFFLLGVALGVIYDVFSVKRILVKTPQTFLVIEDLIFSLLALVCFLIIIFITNYGYVRWYEFVSLFCGFSLYKILLSYFFTNTLLFIIRFIIRITGIILSPFKKLAILIFKSLGRLFMRCREIWYNYSIKHYSAKKLKRDRELSRRGFKA